MRALAPGAVLACALGCGPALAAGLKGPLVEPTPSRGAFRLVDGGVAAPILVDERDHPGVRRAAGDLREDVHRVAAVRPELATRAREAPDVVVAGTVGRSELVDTLVAAGRLDVAAIRGRWEASVVQVVARPWPGVERALVIAGSDPRGTIFGIYDLSENIGVSPWYWWADVAVARNERIFLPASTRWVRGEPAVKYRGIFINDEAPALSGWTKEKFGGFNSRFYAHVFELLLRLRANFLWPAMWGNSIADDDPKSPALANEYGIVLGTSHHEPMMRAHVEWERYGKGPWNYATNAETLRAFWLEGIRRVGDFENIVTLAMRGDGDEPMSREANVALLEKIVADQRAMLAQDPRWKDAPQVWALYKEVQEYYEKGMRVPDDVTLLWCDDNWGNIRRLPTPEERARPGGAGVYYHFDYVGGPRSYKWINTYPIPKVGEQMHLAWRYGATRLWIVNVGDIKPMELPISFFLEYAWDPGAWPPERWSEFPRTWAERLFGPRHAAAVGEMLAGYTRLNSRRKPEMLEPGTYSLLHYAEAERSLREYEDLRARADAMQAALPPEQQAAFFQLARHPIQASAILHALYAAVGRNRLHASQGRATTGEDARLARELFRQDEELTREYNEQLGGKWNHLMDQTHIGYTYWQQPPRNAMPGIQELQVPQRGEMGVAVEGSELSWPGAPGQPTLPALNPFDRAARGVDVFNRGRDPVSFTITASAPWLEADVREGALGPDRTVRVTARWADVPPGTHDAWLRIAGSDGEAVTVKVPVVNPASPRPDTVEGFVETNGAVAIEAGHHDRAIAPKGREWKTIPGHGRTLSGMTPWPVTETAALEAGMRLEYRVNLFRDGPVDVAVHLAPTQKFQPGPGFRFAVSFDDEAPQVVNVHADESQAAWSRSVSDGVTVVTSKHTVKPGAHVLKLWALDPGLVFQKIVVDAGGLKPSYLGPPESPRFVRPARPGS